MNVASSNRKPDFRTAAHTDYPSDTLPLNSPLRSARVILQPRATCRRYLREGIAVLSHRRNVAAGSLQVYMFTAIDPNAVTTPLIGYLL